VVVFVVVFVVVVVVVDDADVAEAEDLLEIVSAPGLFQLLSSEILLHTASLCTLFSVCQARHTFFGQDSSCTVYSPVSYLC